MVLCQTTIVGLGVYAMVIAVTKWQVHPALGFLVAIALGGAVGLLLALLLRRINDAAFVLVTFLLALAGTEAFENLDGITGGRVGLGGLPSMDILSSMPAKAEVAVVLAVVTAGFMLLTSYLRTREFGRAVRALRDDYLGAHLVRKPKFGGPIRTALRNQRSTDV